MLQEVLVDDGNDAKLTQLQIEHGNNVRNGVKMAVSDVREHNPCGSYLVLELWGT